MEKVMEPAGAAGNTWIMPWGVEGMDTEKIGDVRVVRLQGRLGEVSAPQFEDKMKEMIEEGELLFVVDLGGLEYISSAGLRSILSTAKELKKLDGHLFLSGLRGPVREVFEISHFVDIFRIFGSVQEALEAMPQ
jgi:anti-anti-sigma factor